MRFCPLFAHFVGFEGPGIGSTGCTKELSGNAHLRFQLRWASFARWVNDVLSPDRRSGSVGDSQSKHRMCEDWLGRKDSPTTSSASCCLLRRLSSFANPPILVGLHCAHSCRSLVFEPCYRMNTFFVF